MSFVGVRYCQTLRLRAPSAQQVSCPYSLVARATRLGSLAAPCAVELLGVIDSHRRDVRHAAYRLTLVKLCT